jgi:PAS domain S-box-containing protein
MVSCKEAGDFTVEDEALLIQLAALGSLAWRHIEARAEAERRVDELDVVINAMSEAVGICDLDGTLLKVNPAMKEVFGFDVTGHHLRDLASTTHVSHRDGSELPLEELPSTIALSGRKVTNLPLRLVNVQGERLTIQVSTAPLRLHGQIWGAVIAIHDVSDLQAAEEALQFYAEKLEASNRDLESFAYIASHDLQEPLRKVQAFGQQLRVRYGETLDAHGLDYLDRMENAAGRMRAMITDLLNYSRVNRSDPFTAVDLNEVAHDVLSDLEVRREAVQGRVEIDPLPAIEGDPTQLHQLFLNLVGNALKFKQADVPPVVRIRTVPTRPGWVEIRVEDNGIGFEMEYKERIFQPFQRLHGRMEYDGSGIGLAVCRKIVERHSGFLDVTSAPGQGTTFVIRLPLSQAKRG